MIQKKVAMLGMYAVGKTSLVRRFVSSVFDEKYLTTIGVKVDKKTLKIENEDVTLMLWDIAGAEDNFTVPTSYIRGAAGYLLVIDGTRAVTLERSLELVEQIENSVGKLPFVAVLNKVDLEDQWELKEEHLEKLKALGCPVIRGSAATGEGVEEAFLGLVGQIL